MKFLVVSKAKMPFPAEMALVLTEAVEAWAQKYVASGKIEQVWGFAGLQGGGGICNVESLDEFDSMMTEFPYAPFSDTEVYGLTDFGVRMGNQKQLIKKMAPPK